MPKFNLAPSVDDVQPQWPPAPQDNQKLKPPRPSASQARAAGNARIEKAAGSVPLIGGVLKPMAQFANTLASPDTKVGIFTGPVNAVSKLGNAVGDLVQRKPIDTRDAWQISDQQARQVNPWRIGTGQGVTPADQSGLMLGEGIGAELAGAATGATLLRRVSQLGQVKRAADALKGTQAVKNLAVAAKVTPGVRAGLNVGKNVGQAVAGTALAAPFLDPTDGNLANAGDALGLKLPGRVEASDNYFQALGKSLAVEGLAAPMALIGAGSLFAPIRKGLAKGDLGWIDEVANAELEPYMPRGMAGPALPPAKDKLLTPAGTPDAPALPAYTQQGGSIVPYDSAISRSLQEQTQINQVVEQRQRLQDMGLVEMGQGGQLELNVTEAVDPEIRLQIRQLQAERGQTIKAMQLDPEQAQAMDQRLAEIDQEIADLNLAGQGEDFMPAERYSQPELDMPDGRPELDTYLAHLDELDDKQLREVHSRVYRDAGVERNAQELTDAQTTVQGLNDRIAEIQAKADGGEITPVGAKRMLTKAQKELALAQQQVQAIEGRQRLPETLVGDQLEMNISQQLGLPLADEVQLPPFQEITRGAGEFGYRTPDDYRSALQGWNRDLLRRLAMPDSSPEVAALVKARTGRRVWQAKKADIIDALVEISERRGRYLPPEPDQLAMPLTTNPVGADAPLLDVPANLDVPGMSKTLDADGNEVSVPMVDYQARGMDPATRDRMKQEILRRAIDNGEVQAPVTPLPQRPQTSFNQASFVDELMADPEGQLPLLFANDQLPAYKAGGKNADALIEEMRLRFQYNLLDAEAERAQRAAFLAENNWEALDWESKKRVGLASDWAYRLEPYSDRFRDPTPAARSDLDAPKTERTPEPYSKGKEDLAPPPKRPEPAPVEEAPAPEVKEWTPDGPVEKFAAKKQKQVDNALAKELAAKKQQLAILRRNAQLQAKELSAQAAKLEKQILGGKCDG